MTFRDRILCCAYGAVALVALVGTWRENLAFFRETGSWSGFLPACFANHAAASMSTDVLLVALAASVFMVVEARRVGVRFVWVYLVLSVLVAISVMFPLFLVARQRRLAAAREAGAATGAPGGEPFTAGRPTAPR
jgi:hypothetical protein